MSGVTFDSVSKAFGKTLAVKDFTLDVKNGEFMVLLGPSGCGKTTALRMIAGLEEVTSGYLSIGDRVVNNTPAKDRDIAMVFQSYALYPHMTVRKNIESPLVANRSARVPAIEREERVNEAAEILGLTEYLGRKPGELSGGQRQRVALARAIVRRPEVFLMDEPLSNLDAKLRTQTRLEIVELHKRLGTTFVYVTHDQVEAMTMADRIAVIADGTVQQVGPPQEVYDSPANLFVARFIGSPPMNTIAGTHSPGHDSGVVSTESGAIQLGGHAQDLTHGHPVTVGIRPEHLRAEPIRSEPAGDGSNTDRGLTGTVLATELLGHEIHLIVSLDSQRFVVRHPTAAAHGEPIHVGSRVLLHPVAAEVKLFDTNSTHAIPITRHAGTTRPNHGAEAEAGSA
jgi:ABC-type sugar transport system ATPase subunit